MSDASSLSQLISVRFKEYTREPEALFWSFGFPILLAIGLGIAFRSKPPDVVHVAVIDEPLVAQTLSRDKAIVAEAMSADSARLALRTGRVAVVVDGDPHGVAYEYDDTRPESRTARLLVNDALQRSRRRPPIASCAKPVRATSISSFPACSA